MSPATGAPPHVVIVHWHDLGTWLSPYGHQVPSPHLAAFARDSFTFTRCFSTSPLCSPARGSLWTGRYPHTNGLQGLTHRGWEYHPEERTLPMHLSDANYHTALIGLQHESRDDARLGFDEMDTSGSSWAPEVAERASRWLTQHAEDDQPFLLTCGVTEVHRDWPADRYPPLDPDKVEVPPYLPDNEHTRSDLAAFARAIEVADTAFGQIMAALRETGLAERTLVVFTTDHGAPFPRAKSTLYDPGVNVALLMRLPQNMASREPGDVPDLVSHVDLVPTLLDLLGIDVPTTVQGSSFAPTLRDGALPGRDHVYLEKTYHADYDPIRAVRTSRYKYIVNAEDRPLLDLPPDLENSPTRHGMGEEHLRPRPRRELYDLRHDPGETVNLAEDEDHSALARGLHEHLVEFLAETEDPLLDGPVPPPRVP